MFIFCHEIELQRPGSSDIDVIPILLGTILVAGIITGIVLYVKSRK